MIGEDNEKWWSLLDCAEYLERTQELPRGLSQRWIGRAGESGEVRARWRLHYSGQKPLLARHDWIGADVNATDDLVLTADGARMRSIVLNENDFVGFATRQILHASNVVRAPELVKPGDAAKMAVATCFPQGVPADLQNGPMCKRLAAWMREHFPHLREISDATLLRAAGRKK